MTLHILAEPMLEFQLRKAPLPVDMWSRWPQLRRPVLILLVSLLMAAAAVGCGDEEGVVSAAPPLTVPVVWSFLGYHFPAGSMIVGLLACLMVRLFITLDAPGPKRWLLDGIVTGVALLVTAVWIEEHQVDLFAALGTGGMVGGGSSASSSGAARVRSTRWRPHCRASLPCRPI